MAQWRRWCTSTTTLALLSVLMVSFSSGQQCDCTPQCIEDEQVTNGLCPFNRTISRTDCDCCHSYPVCARQAGQSCDAQLLPCDSILGLQCDPFSSTCQGPFGIQVLETSHNSTVIRWRTEPMSHFVVLTKYQDNKDEDNETQWDIPPTTYSDDGTVAVGGLKSSSVYFIKVKDESTNKSETVIIKTHDGCESNETWYGVGEAFSVGCQERCLCSEGGVAQCRPRCKVPQEMMESSSSSTSLHSSASSTSCRTMPDPDDPTCCLLITCDEKAMGPVGDPKVIVTGRTPSSLALAWDDFKAPNYNHGYVVEYRAAVNTEDPFKEPDPWQRIQASNAPNATIPNLQPHMLYNIRVAVWEDFESQRLGAWTEALSSSTEDGCLWENSTYRVGETYSKACEERCTCTLNGTSECGQDICSLPYHKVGSFADDELCFETPSGDDPCCVIVACASNKQPTTKVKFESLTLSSVGECPSFVPDVLGSCKSTCKSDNDCMGNKCCLTGCGSTVCVSPVKPFGGRQKTTPVKEGCTSGGTMYAVGEEFDNGCQLKCQCLDRDGKFEIHCQPRCPMIQEKLRALKDPNCRLMQDPRDKCCKVLVCDASDESSTSDGFFENDTEGHPIRKQIWEPLTPHPQRPGCLYKNQTYNEDEHFEDGCESLCHCLVDGQVQCVPRCELQETLGDGCVMLPSPTDSCCEVAVCENMTTTEKPISLENDTVVNETATKMLNTTIVEELFDNYTTTETTWMDSENDTTGFNDNTTSGVIDGTTSEFIDDTTAGFIHDTTSGFIHDTTTEIIEGTTSSFIENATSGFLNDTASNFNNDTRLEFVDDTTSEFMDETSSEYIDDTTSEINENTTSVFNNDTSSNSKNTNATLDYEDDIQGRSFEKNTTADLEEADGNDSLTTELLSDSEFNATLTNFTSLPLIDHLTTETVLLNSTWDESDSNTTDSDQNEVFQSLGVNSTEGLREALLKIKLDGDEYAHNATNITVMLPSDEHDANETLADEEDVFRSMGVNSTEDLKSALLDIRQHRNNTSVHWRNTTSRSRVFSDLEDEDYPNENATIDHQHLDFFNSTSERTGFENVTHVESSFDPTLNVSNSTMEEFNATEATGLNSTDLTDFLQNSTDSTSLNDTMGSKQKEMRLLWDEMNAKPAGHPAFIREVLSVDQSTVRMQMLLSQPLMEKLFMGDRTLLVLYTDRLSKVDGFNEWQRHDLALQQNVAFVSVNGSEVGLETFITDLEPNRQYYFVVAREKEVNDPDMGLQFDDLSQIASTTTIRILNGTCEFMGKTLNIGERLNDECNTVCDCLPEQQLRCEAMLCMNQLSSDKTGCLEWEVDRTFFPRPPHCCPAVACKYGSMCTYKGHKFHNLEMIPSDLVDDCTLECKCVVGNVTCQPRCPPVAKEAPQDMTCNAPQLVLMENDQCCHHWYCPEVATTTLEPAIFNDTAALNISESGLAVSEGNIDEETTLEPNVTTVISNPTTELIFEQGMCVFQNVTYRMGDQWHVGEGHREQLCSCILLNNGSASPECQGGCRSIPEQYSALASDCPPQFLVIRDVPNLCPYVMCNKTDHGRGVTNVTAVPLNATSIRITFTIPNIYVGLFGHVEALYTTEISQSEDTTNWNKEVFSGHGNLFEHAVISHELSNLLPDTVYYLKVLVILMDAQNMASSDVIQVHMPPTPTVEPSTTTTTLPPMLSLDAALNFTDEQPTSVKVLWRSFDSSEKRVIDGVRLKYKAKDDPDAQWSQTELIHRDVTAYTLGSLRPDMVYDVDVVFVAPVNVSTEVLSSHPSSFRTLPLIDKFEFNLTLRADKVTPYSVDLIWNGVPFPENKYVTVYRVQYKPAKTKDDSEPRSMFRPPKGNQFQLTLENLNPNTSYDIWMDAYLLNGKTRSSVPISVITKPGPIIAKASEKEKLESSLENSNVVTGSSYYAALIVVAVIAALCGLGFVILLIILLRKQSTAKAPITNPKSHTAYDNPTYKIYDNDIENGKTHT